MNIHFTGRHIAVTQGLEDLIKKKFERMNQHLENIPLNIILTVEKMNNIIEANVHFNGKDISAKGESDDMHKAIDIVVKKLEAQLRKIKEKKHCGCHCESMKKKIAEVENE